MRKYLILFVLNVYILNSLYSQKTSEYDYKMPLPPETYQFQKRLLNNVSLFTGQPSIDIPIYTINIDGIEIPISVSYNTGGIKVEEDATCVGLGWSLNVGGQITRSCNGLPDERYFINKSYNSEFGVGGLKQNIPNYDQYTRCDIINQNRNDFYYKAFLSGESATTNQPIADCRPDEFTYSFFGYNGKFMFSQEQSKFITFPLNDIDINYHLGTLNVAGDYNFFEDFDIKLSNGFRVVLGNEGKSYIYTYLQSNFPLDQSWKIKKIYSERGKEITFNYLSSEYYMISNYAVQTETYFSSPSVLINSYPVTNVTKTNEKLVSEIIFPEGKIVFNYSDRNDLQTGAKKLDEIIILDNNNNLIRKITFIQTYFIANDGSVPNNSYLADVYNKRLKLDQINFYGNQNDLIEKYIFDYYQTGVIPSKASKAQDHWGYFNGKTTNTSLLPKNLISWYNEESSFGFNRELDLSSTKIFSLKSIKYPEGGIKYFEYENHEIIPNSVSKDFFKDISNDQYEIVEKSFMITGYSLNNFYPNPNQTNNFNKIFYSSDFNVNNTDTYLLAGEYGILINSNLPFQVPNYLNINADYNKISFYIEKLETNNSYNDFKFIGTISKNQNSNQTIKGKLMLPEGTYRLKIIVTQNYSLSNPNDYNFPHYTNFKFRFRRKIKNEIKIGGLRIKEINTYENSSLSNPTHRNSFIYLDDFNHSSGHTAYSPYYLDMYSLSVPHPNEPMYTSFLNEIKFTSNSILSLNKINGSNVGYTKVTLLDVDPSNNQSIKEDRYFSFIDPLYSDLPDFHFLREFEPKEWQQGKLLKKVFYKDTNTPVKEELYEYYSDNVQNNLGYIDEINYQLLDKNELCNNYLGYSKHIPGVITGANQNYYLNYLSENIQNNLLNIVPYAFQTFYNNKYSISSYYDYLGISHEIPYFKKYTGFDKLKSKTTKTFFGSAFVEEKVNYHYDLIPSNLQLTSTDFTDSQNDFNQTKYFYATNPEMSSEPNINILISKNMIGIPLKTENYRGSEKLSEKTTKYGNFPSSISGQHLLLPQYIYAGKGNNTEKKVTFNFYDTNGNITQYTQESGVPITIIWGYNKTIPIAKIENATNTQIATALGVPDLNSITEANISAIDALRTNSSLPNVMISTYTHIPLVGVSTITDPKGDKITYTYDSFGRLQSVKDKDNNTLSENQYHYKP